MGIQLPDGRSLSDDVLSALRLRALRGCEMGFTEADVAQMLGLSRETVSRWWSAYAEGGLQALPEDRTGRPPGAGRLLDGEQAEHIRGLIDRHTPEDLGIAAPLWDRKAVRALIAREYGIDLAVRTVGEYLARWGYTAKRPSRRAKKQDAEEVREWLEETYPEIERQAEEEGATIHFGDETGVAADHHPRLGYARRGEAATMAVPDPHVRVNVLSTLTNTGEFHFMTYTRTMNAALFVTFLEQLLAETTGKVYLITDRLSAHDCELVEEWVAKNAERIRLFFLPRRSPELNPTEYLNNDLKGNIHDAGLPDTKAQLLARVQAFLDALFAWPARVRKYFKHPAVQFAS